MFKSQIKQFRRRRGLRQLDLARAVGASEAMISKIETGRSIPDEFLLQKILAELQITSLGNHEHDSIRGIGLEEISQSPMSLK